MTKKSALASRDKEILECLDQYRKKRRLFELFSQSVQSEFSSNPQLNTGTPTTIHSIKSRLKDENHLSEKIIRKRKDGKTVTKDNIFKEINDLAGIRILHLYQDQFTAIHKFIHEKIKSKSWKLLEKPIAYSWDPESVEFYKKFSIKTLIKPSFYTSVHYLSRPLKYCTRPRDILLGMFDFLLHPLAS